MDYFFWINTNNLNLFTLHFIPEDAHIVKMCPEKAFPMNVVKQAYVH